MKISYSFYLLLLLWLFIGTSCIRENLPESEERITVGDVLPSFQVRLDDGNVFSESQFDGKIGVIVFFHTDCPDCRMELPVIQKLYDCYRNDKSVLILCISREEGKEQIDAYWKQAGLSVPYSAQTDRTVYELFCTVGIPRIYIAGPDRVVRAVYTDNPLATLKELERSVEACR